ncbi:MAG: TonB-dependent receptor domain-containing protein, partial [Gammaproteobacteria bacterium]
EGFKKFVRPGVSVTSFQNVRVDVTLEVGAITQSVVVAGEAPLVDTRNATVGNLVDDKRIVDLPLNGRNILSFASIIPGVTRTAITGANDVSFSQQRININGNRAYSTNVQLDGGSMFYSHRGQSLNLPPPDAVQEIKVVSAGVTAEYGRGTAVISAVTKSGANDMHGSLWNYFRNDDLDARRSSDLRKAKLRYNQFGGSVGGPIIKNRLFYFGAFQGIRTRQEASASSAFPPTAAERRGDFSASNPAPIDPTNGQPFPGRTIPTSRFDPVAVKLLDKIPLPNDPSGRLAGLTPTPTSGENVIGKFDFAATQKDRLSLRYYFDYIRGVMAYPVVVSPGSNIPGYSPSPSSTDIQGITVNYNRTWSSTLLVNARGSFTRFTYDEAGGVRQTLADLGAVNFIDAGAPSPPRLPQIVVNGRFSASPGKDRQRVGSTYDYAGDWTWLSGPHEFKWGGQVLRTGFLTYNNSASSGRFVFDGTFSRNNMADYLLGRIQSFTQNSLSDQGGKYYIPSFYVQDNYKVHPRLTLNLGVRWEIYTPWSEDKGAMAMYVPGARSSTFRTAPLGFIYQTDPEYIYDTDGVNIGPRIGFAWDVFGDGRTSVRGGYAVSYDGLQSEFLLANNQPFSLSVDIRNAGTLSNPYANTPNPFPYKV